MLLAIFLWVFYSDVLGSAVGVCLGMFIVRGAALNLCCQGLVLIYTCVFVLKKVRCLQTSFIDVPFFEGRCCFASGSVG